MVKLFAATHFRIYAQIDREQTINIGPIAYDRIKYRYPTVQFADTLTTYTRILRVLLFHVEQIMGECLANVKSQHQ